MPMSRSRVRRLGEEEGGQDEEPPSEVMEGGDETNHRQQHSFGEGRNSAATDVEES